MADVRMPPLAKENYSSAQQQAADDFLELRKTSVFGPFDVLMRSPELMTSAAKMGDYLRFHSVLGRRLTEFTILLIARWWSQDYEWYVHSPLALEAGVASETTDAIRDGRRPAHLAPDEETVYDFVTELLYTKRVSDMTYAKALDIAGEPGVVDLVGLCGFYTLIAMTLTVGRVSLPPDGVPLPRFPE